MNLIRGLPLTRLMTAALAGLLLTSCISSGTSTKSPEIRLADAAAIKAAAEVKPQFAELPAKCTQKMARVAPPQSAGGLVRNDTEQWNLNADAQDARTGFCANFYRAAMNGGYKGTS